MKKATPMTQAERESSYQKLFRRMTIVPIISASIAFFSASYAWFSISHQPEPMYIALKDDGTAEQLVAVSQPYLRDEMILSFAVDAITRAFSFNFATWQQDLDEAAPYFEQPTGWGNYMAALTESQNLETIRKRRMISTVVANAPVIINSGENYTGRFAWIVQVPLTITYQSAAEKNVTQSLAEVEITRLPTTVNPNAMGITRINVQ